MARCARKTAHVQALLNIVLPIFAVVATGYICGRSRLLGAASSDALNLFVYWVALPALLFKAMAGVNLGQVLNLNFITAYTLAMFATWALSALAAMAFFRLGAAEGSLFGLNGAYANAGYMGIPLSIAAYGEAAALPSIVATVISVLFIAIAVIPVEISQQRETRLLQTVGRVVKSLLRNPMLLAPVAGLTWAWFGQKLPVPVENFAGMLGAAAGPCALFSIGLFLVGKPLSQGTGQVAAMTVVKLLIHPLLTAAAIFTVFPTDPMWTKIAILSAALPIGSGPFVLAQAKGVYVQPTSAVMLVTTILSVATISLFFVYFPAAM